MYFLCTLCKQTSVVFTYVIQVFGEAVHLVSVLY